jgi:hypothetical protein
MWHHTPMVRTETLSAQSHGKRITTHVYWDHLRDVLFARQQVEHLGDAEGLSMAYATAEGVVQ